MDLSSILEAVEGYAVLLVPAITGIVEVAKRVGLPPKAAMVLALVLGVAAGVVYASPGDWRVGILVGVMLGLSAMGLYDVGKKGAESIRESGPQDGGDLGDA